MSSRPASCSHELRPGTTVCLLCRHADHVAAVRRRRGHALRIGGVTLVLATAVVGGRALLTSPTPGDGTPPTSLGVTAEPNSATEEHVAPAPASVAPVGTPAVVRSPAPAPATRATVALVAEGRTALRDGLVAVRSGDTVAVHFDTPATRTRRFDKFERIVRETLPQVYGAVADSVLARVPAGQLARSGHNLLTELPERGLHLPTGDGGTLALWPETRPGRDGPLVVTYRATLARDGTR